MRLRTENYPRKNLQALLGNAKRVQPWNGRLAAHLQHLHLAHHRIAIHALIEPQETIRYGEDRVGLALARLIFAHQERRRLPPGELKRELLDEVLQIEVAARAAVRCMDDGAK